MSRYVDLSEEIYLCDDAEYETYNVRVDAPSVDICFCKDCKHYNAGFECLINGYGIERPPMWFCGDGERECDE